MPRRQQGNAGMVHAKVMGILKRIAIQNHTEYMGIQKETGLQSKRGSGGQEKIANTTVKWGWEASKRTTINCSKGIKRRKAREHPRCKMLRKLKREADDLTKESLN